MAFKKRFFIETEGVEKTSAPEVSTSEKFEINKDEIKSYKEDCIRTIEILENKGIFLYDEKRYGGMYLKSKISKDKKIELLFDVENETENNLDNKLNEEKLLSIFS